MTTLSYEYKDGHVVPHHFHVEDQLVFASLGVMTIRTEEGLWVVPPLRAVWIPGRVVHSIDMSGIVSMRTLYFSPGFVRQLPRRCLVLNISSLLKELILHACATPSLSMDNPRQRNLIACLVDQMTASGTLPLQLPQPSDPRARRIADALMSDPGDQRPLAELCRKCGASKRTIERLFLDETRMAFGRWRQQLRLLHAMKLLATGEKVTSVALASGYSTPSAFTAMFRKALGAAPSHYFSDSSQDRPGEPC